MTIKLFFLYLVGVVSVLMAIMVLLRNQKSIANRSFFAMVFAVGLWGSGIATFLLVNESLPALIAAKVYYFSAMATAVFVTIFTLSFPEPKKICKKFSIYIMIALFLFGLALIKKNFLTEDLIYHNWGKEIILNEISYGIYAVILLLLFSYSFFNLLQAVRTHRRDKGLKQQVWLLFFGLLFSAIIGIFFNLILPWLKNYKLIWAGPLAVSTFLIVASYSILKLKLFNIRIIIARSMAYIFSLFVIVGGYSLLTLVLASLFFETSMTIQQIAYFALVSIIAALAFQPVKRFFDRVSNKLFYRDAYDTQELLNKINSSIVSTTDLQKLLESTAEAIRTNIKAGFCNFYIDGKTVLEFHTAGTHTRVFKEKRWDALLEKLELSKAKIFSAEQRLDEKTSSLMHDLKTDAILRLTSQNQNVGYLVVGQKQSGNSFTSQDIQILEIIADEVAIAVQNTLRYEEIANFNITLQKRIKDATEELQRNNQKLRQLDEAKDEFISMASHQLRTPLTSVKGYLSMLLEGDAGKVNKQQHKFLDQAFISSQRMVYLISDLLNVSRLKTGKFVIEPTATYLPDVVETELAQLTETAKARGLELIYSKPKEFCTLNLDETKIRQVIMNFSDNAIHYTPKGGKITVELKQTDSSIEFTVTDTGIGVPKADQHHMFTKFYRGSNAKKSRPDGTGLGLFMAKKVIVAQGGAIIFKTKEGEGSTFGFTFPRAKLETTPVKPSKK